MEKEEKLNKTPTSLISADLKRLKKGERVGKPNIKDKTPMKKKLNGKQSCTKNTRDKNLQKENRLY